MIRIHPWSNRTVLVTGGAGYIGSRLIRDLATDTRFQGVTVRILDNLQRGVHDGLMNLPGEGKFEFIEADLFDDVAVRHALDGVDAVVHLAALVKTPFSFDHPTWTEHVNHWGTARLAESCIQAGVRRFVFASSASVYGPGGPYDEDAPCNPVGPYSQSKLRAEEALQQAAGRGLSVTIVRIATVFGIAPAVRFDAVPNRLAYLAAVHRPMAIHGSGEQTRAVIHVADAASALAFCLVNDDATSGRVLNAGAENVSVHDLGQALQDIAGDTSIRFTDQHALARFSLAVSSDRLRDLGWKAGVTLKAGLGEILHAFGPFARRAAMNVAED